MTLTLSIENQSRLPDGGPLSVTVTGKRGIDIGRDTHLDWTLPDPTRYISGKHCEVRFKDGAYWLHDVSTNGTFLHGDEGRLKGPHRLRNGDRLGIGNYIIAVALVEAEAAEVPAVQAPSPTPYADLWDATEDAAPPVDRALVRAPKEAPRPVQADFLDWAAEVPQAGPSEGSGFGEPVPRAPHGSAVAPDDFSWSSGTSKPSPPEEPQPAVPSPRRPVWISTEPAGPWGAGGSGAMAEADGSKPVEARAASPGFALQVSPATPDPESQATLPALPPITPAAVSSQLPPSPGPARLPAADERGVPSFAGAVARGANVPEQTLAEHDPEQLAEQLGALMRLIVDNLRQLLNARTAAKRLVRAPHQTTIQAIDNNPLKFSPTTDDALRLLLGSPTRSYMPADRAFAQSFGDLKKHQLQTYAAMQAALAMLVEDLDPEAISRETEPDRGIAAVVGSRKARLWDAYVARWQAKAGRHEGGMVDVYMQYFADCYDRDADRGR